MDSKAKLLIVEDDLNFCQTLERCLAEAGFEVKAVHRGAAVEDALSAVNPDLVMLDLHLPDCSGLDLCREIKKRHKVPIVMLTGSTDDIDKVAALELGAVHFLSKPMHPRVLVAYIRSALRLVHETPSEQEDVGGLLEFLNFQLNTHTHQLFDRTNDKKIKLQAAEYRLLLILLEHVGRVLSRDHILNLVGDQGDISDRSVDCLIYRLRKKLVSDGNLPLITTVRGGGYLLDVPVVRH